MQELNNPSTSFGGGGRHLAGGDKDFAAVLCTQHCALVINLSPLGALGCRVSALCAWGCRVFVLCRVLAQNVYREHMSSGSLGALACHGKGLGEAVDGEGARPHAGQRSEGVVLGRRVDDVLIDLIRQHQQPRVLRHYLCQLLCK